MTIKSTLALALLAAAAPTLAARTGHDPYQAKIETAGLDLRRPADQSELLARAAKAADRVCGMESSLTSDGGIRLGECRARFLETARGRITKAMTSEATPR